MNRRDFASLLLCSLGTAGCDLFQDKKQPLSGERIQVTTSFSRIVTKNIRSASDRWAIEMIDSRGRPSMV